MSMAYLLHIDTVTGTAEDEAGLHRLCEALRLQRDLFLLFPWKVDKVVVLGPYQEWDRGLVEASSLSVPLLDGVECGLSR